MRPKIAVLPLHNTEKHTLWINPLYFAGIEQAGGLPVLLPLNPAPALWTEYVNAFDGFVFTGGQDIDPAIYGEAKLPECGYQSLMRDRQEAAMIRLLLKVDKPVLGICRGIQVINAAAGGTLWQDLPSQAPSSVVHLQQMPYNLPHHQVSILPDTILRDAIGYSTISVNSMHHQAVKTVAPGFRISAVAPDGIVEAIEHPEKRFFAGVQWHPEHMWQDYGSARRLWHAFVSAC